jgi:hypothetical protein
VQSAGRKATPSLRSQVFSAGFCILHGDNEWIISFWILSTRILKSRKHNDPENGSLSVLCDRAYLLGPMERANFSRLIMNEIRNLSRQTKHEFQCCNSNTYFMAYLTKMSSLQIDSCLTR